MMEIKDVVAGYGKRRVLRGVSLSPEQGRITTLAGANGSGKSTLLKALMGLIPMEDGDITVDGVSVKEMSRAEIAARIAWLPQGKNIPDITAGRMVLHGRFPYLSWPRKYTRRDFAIAEEAMERMGISELADARMAELSGGMRQKVYIAMALAQQAPVIVMDEPTTYLDIGQQLKFARMVRQLSEEGKTILLVLHDLLLACKISHKIAVLHEGRILGCGTPTQIMESRVTEKLWGVSVRSLRTEAGTQYFYEIPGEETCEKGIDRDGLL